MFVKIFDNYHAGVALLPEAEQDAFYGAVVRYAFEGKEPEFDGIALAVWLTVKDFIDKSARGQENGSKGGNGRGNRNPSETPSGRGVENPPGKGGPKTPSENQRKGKEGNGKENPEGFFSNSRAAGGAVAQGAPPAAFECPACGAAMERTNAHRGGRALHRCPLCAEEVWQ